MSQIYGTGPEKHYLDHIKLITLLAFIFSFTGSSIQRAIGRFTTVDIEIRISQSNHLPKPQNIFGSSQKSSANLNKCHTYPAKILNY